MTLVSLASQAGITKGYLSKIEYSANPPTFSTLQSLAGALETDVGQFLAEKPPAAVSRNLEIHQPDEGHWQASHGLGGYRFLSLLGAHRGKYMSPFLMRVPPGSTHYFKHDGEELLFVLDGDIELEYEGKTHPLRPGASAYLDSRIRHRFHNRTKADAQLLAVNFAYRRF
ncbi:MAG: cupin domain-containing protein [Phycisphaerales bacterium]|nr:cupin domain-containing protein [Phycisphaerales bacterium]